MTRPKILGVIPARGGSKGVPGKNIRALGGLPLLGHTILRARESGALDRLWVSTDDAAIAEAAARCGARPAWLRPAELAQDASSMVDVLKHLLARLAQDEGYRPDAVMILQPTSPFRTADTIRRAAALFEEKGRRTVVSVAESRSHPYWSYRVEKDGTMRPFIDGLGKPTARQTLPAAYALDGSMHLIETARFLRQDSFYGPDDVALVVPPEEAVDIDTPFDWDVAEGLWERRSPAPPPSPLFIIAEAGVNHNGRLEDAKRLADAAKAAGADAVKFQTFRADALVAAGAPKAAYQERTAPGAKGQKELIAALELDEAAHAALRDHCRRIGIRFLSTPFDPASADMLERLGVDLFKVSSGDLTNKPLLEHLARKGRPLVLSTGMSSLEEVAAAVAWVRAAGAREVSLMHCVTEYPAPPEQSNLLAMETMRRAFRVPVGFSDHTSGVEISIAAAALGAELLEKHLTLDRTQDGPDHAASLEPDEFAALVRGARLAASARGDGAKKAALCELGNRAVARRSLVSARDLPAGTALSAADLAFKRPGTGIPPADAEAALGRRLKRAVPADTVLTWKDLE